MVEPQIARQTLTVTRKWTSWLWAKLNIHLDFSLLRFKILFQKLCQCKSDWDDLIHKELIEEWTGLISRPMYLPRSYLYNITDPLTSITLCGFCDASTKAIAAVVYLLLRTKTNSVARFVAAMTRVAPLQSQTISRLELLSAFLLSRLVVSVRDGLQPQTTPVTPIHRLHSTGSVASTRNGDPLFRIG